jgi:hypothetical protein
MINDPLAHIDINFVKNLFHYQETAVKNQFSSEIEDVSSGRTVHRKTTGFKYEKKFFILLQPLA